MCTVCQVIQQVIRVLNSVIVRYFHFVIKVYSTINGVFHYNESTSLIAYSDVHPTLSLKTVLPVYCFSLRLLVYCSCLFNPLKTKRRPLYLKTQSVPHCKHFSSWL